MERGGGIGHEANIAAQKGRPDGGALGRGERLQGPARARLGMPCNEVDRVLTALDAA
jgi:hypothetical protein